MRGLRVEIGLRMLSASEGGRSKAIASGYRPLCLLEDEGRRQVGLCELILDVPIGPGGSGSGYLVFDEDVAEVVRHTMHAGTKLTLAEGRRPVAQASVTSEPSVFDRRLSGG